MKSRDLEKIFAVLRENFSFKKGIEVTCEANPGDISKEKARCLRSLGVNRVSLGAQTFHDRTLKQLNRVHNARDIFESFGILRKEGFGNINLDLMLSLPGETLDDVKFSLEKIVELSPEHVSLYELVVEEKTVFGRRAQKGKLALPHEETQLEMLTFARKYLKAKNFEHYELLNYAKAGFRSRHNLIYWANGEYLGLGPGAFSYVDGRRFRHSSDFEEYMKKASGHDWSAFEEETLTGQKHEVESFLLALRLTEGASLKKFEPILKNMRNSVLDFSKKGLVEIKKGKIRFTERGQFFAETIFSEFSSTEP